MHKNWIWITWESHRRSEELAKAFQAKYIVLDIEMFRVVRYVILSVLTFYNLLKEKPNVVFCQNPSVVLATILCVYKYLLKYILIVDRHSNFKFKSLQSKKLKWKLFHILSKYSIRKSDLTIVTNDNLAKIVENMNGHAFVLPDKLPQFSIKNKLEAKEDIKGKSKYKVTFITTFSIDEPIHESIDACMHLSGIDSYFTGNWKKMFNYSEVHSFKKDNIHFTGYIPEHDYLELLSSSNILVILTKSENLLTCGAYEALAFKKPMVLSNTNAIKSYFNFGAVYVNPDSNNIANGIQKALEEYKLLQDEIKKNLPKFIEEWKSRFNNVYNYILSLN